MGSERKGRERTSLRTLAPLEITLLSLQGGNTPRSTTVAPELILPRLGEFVGSLLGLEAGLFSGVGLALPASTTEVISPLLAAILLVAPAGEPSVLFVILDLVGPPRVVVSFALGVLVLVAEAELALLEDFI